MNQQQNQSRGEQSQRQGKSGEPDQQEQATPEPGSQGEHLLDEDDGIPGSEQDPDTSNSRQLEQSEIARKQQGDQPRTGSDDERI